MDCFENQDFLMNTIVEQKIYCNNAIEVYKKVVDEVKRLEDLMSFFKDGSEVSKLNKMAGKGEVQLSSEVALVLEAACRFSRLSRGAFDITIAPVIDLFRQCKKISQLPQGREVEELLKLVDYKRVKVDKSAGVAFLEKKGSCVDLGGIAKGFAADTCVEIYKSMGVNSAFVNFGGNVKALGKKPNSEDWVVGIQHPDKARGNHLGAVLVSNKSVVTSGGYERYFEVGGNRYHHILDPRTGWPAKSNIKSVTVICENSMQADALSTAAFVMGLEDGRDLIYEANDVANDVDAVFVTEDNDIYLTKGIQESFVLTGKDPNCNCYAF